MTVYAVIARGFFPAQVESLWIEQPDAEDRAKALTEEYDDGTGQCAWDAIPMRVRSKQKETA